MNSQQMINSIYNPRKKPREPFAFPKINKAEATPPQNKVFVRGGGRKYNQHNIFKIEDEKKQRVKLHLEEERLRELRQREAEDLELKTAAMNRRHQEEMRQIEEQQKKVQEQIDSFKKNQYQIKYSLWELKNQIMNLNAIYLEQEAEYQRLYQEVGYVEDDPDDPDDPDQLEQPQQEEQAEQEQPQPDQEEGQEGVSALDRAVYMQESFQSASEQRHSESHSLV